MLTAFDYGALAIVLLSALQGIWRGLLAEVFALIGWIAAFLLAGGYAGQLAPHLPGDLPGGVLTQLFLAFAIIVIAVKVGAGIVGAILARLTELVGLKSVDRSLGMLFGLTRGVLLVLILVALSGLTDVPKYPFWQNALLLPYAEQGVNILTAWLPDGLAAYVRQPVHPAQPPAAKVIVG